MVRQIANVVVVLASIVSACSKQAIDAGSPSTLKVGDPSKSGADAAAEPASPSVEVTHLPTSEPSDTSPSPLPSPASTISPSPSPSPSVVPSPTVVGEERVAPTPQVEPTVSPIVSPTPKMCRPATCKAVRIRFLGEVLKEGDATRPVVAAEMKVSEEFTTLLTKRIAEQNTAYIEESRSFAASEPISNGDLGKKNILVGNFYVPPEKVSDAWGRHKIRTTDGNCQYEQNLFAHKNVYLLAPSVPLKVDRAYFTNPKTWEDVGNSSTCGYNGMTPRPTQILKIEISAIEGISDESCQVCMRDDSGRIMNCVTPGTTLTRESHFSIPEKYPATFTLDDGTNCAEYK